MLIPARSPRSKKFVNGLFFSTCLISAWVAPETAIAQEQDAASTGQGSETAGLQEIIVTARRSSESAQDVPIALTTISSEKLEDLSVKDVVDVQKVTPGLYIQSNNSGGRAKLTIRGQSEADTRLTTDGSVGVYIDSVAIPRSYGLRTSLVDIAQVEVLKGPQGTLFGKNTTGGALNITTEHPHYEWGGYADLTYGSYNLMKGLAVINAPLARDALALRLVGQVTAREGFGKFVLTGQDANLENSLYGRALLRADPTDSISILLSADYAKQRNNDRAFVLTNDSMLENQNSANGVLGAMALELGLDRNSEADRIRAYNVWRSYYDAYQNGDGQDSYAVPPSDYGPFYDDFDHYGFSGNVEFDFGGVALRFITAYRVVDQGQQSESDATPFELLLNYSEFSSKNFSQELQLSSIDGNGLDWQLGAYYNRERGRLYSVGNVIHYLIPSNARIEDSDTVSTSKAAYAQAVYNFTPDLRVTGGIRYTKDKKTLDSHNRTDPTLALAPSPAVGRTPFCNLLDPALGGPTFPNCSYVTSTSSDKVTWLIGADWRPVPELMVYGSVSTGYRAGGFTEQASSSVITSLDALEAAYTPFDPENVTNYELGFKSDLFGRRLRINGAAYYQDYTDVQVRVRDVVNNLIVNLIRNSAKATIYGAELEVLAEPVDGLSFNGSVAYLNASYDQFVTLDGTGNLIDLTDQEFSAPEWTFNLGASYEVPLADGSLRLSANYAYTGTVNLAPGQPGLPLNLYDPASVTQERYGLLDARISWRIDSQDLELAVFGKNLTDKKYFLYAAVGQSLGWNAAATGDPRVFGIQARKYF